MESEKETEKVEVSECCGHDGKNYGHYFGPLRMCFMVCGAVIIFAGVFALGRISASHTRLASTGIVRDIQVERGDMMGQGNFEQGGRNKIMSGRRGGREQQLGEVTAINGNTMTVKINNTDYTVVVTDATSYDKVGNIAKQSDLKVGDTISIRGSSNSQGQIVATVISIE